MNREAFVAGIAMGAILEASRWAFASRTRKEIGLRDDWECQGLYGALCYWEEEGGEPASHQKGYYVQAAHWPETHQKEPDRNPEHGRILCSCCHATEELLRNNKWGAKMILKSGIMTFGHEERTGEQLRLTPDDLYEFVDSRLEQYNEYQRQLNVEVYSR